MPLRSQRKKQIMKISLQESKLKPIDYRDKRLKKKLTQEPKNLRRMKMPEEQNLSQMRRLDSKERKMLKNKN
jgi:hypothetical protein